MATSLELCGFEGGDFTGVQALGGAAIAPTSARSGNYGLHLTPNNTASYGIAIGAGLDVGSRLAFATYLQCYVRFNGPPSANNSMFMGFGNGDTVIGMNIDRTLTVTKAGIGTLQRGNPMPLNLWLRCIVISWVAYDSPLPAQAAILNTSFQWSYRDANGVLGALDAFTINGAALNSHNYLQGILGGQVGSGSATSWDVDIDDVIYLAADSIADMNTIEKWMLHDSHGAAIPGSFVLPGSMDYLPSLFYHDHIEALKITTEAPSYGFFPGNNAAVIRALPSATSRVPLVTSQVQGASATYFKDQVSNQQETWIFHDITGPDTYTGIIVPKTVEGYQLKGNATAAPASSHQLLLDSIIPTPPVSALSGSSANGNASSPRAPARYLYGQLGTMMPVASFNALQMQLINKTGDLVSLTNLYVEYLTGTGVAGVPGQTKSSGVPPETTTPGQPPPGPSPEPPPVYPPPVPYRVACKDPDVTGAGTGIGGGCKDPDVVGSDGS